MIIDSWSRTDQWKFFSDGAKITFFCLDLIDTHKPRRRERSTICVILTINHNKKELTYKTLFIPFDVGFAFRLRLK